MIDRFVDLALGDMPDRALELVAANPELRDDPWVALCLGDASRIEDVNAPGGPRDAPPILYACVSKAAERPIDAVRDLLARGADPNVRTTTARPISAPVVPRASQPARVSSSSFIAMASIGAGAEPLGRWSHHRRRRVVR